MSRSLTVSLLLAAIVGCSPKRDAHLASGAGGDDRAALSGDAAAREGRAGGQVAPDRSEARPAPPGGGAEAPAGNACDATFNELSNVKAGVPRVFTDMTRTRAELNAAILRGVDLAETFLRDCPEPDRTPLVRAWLGRLLFSRYQYERRDLKESGLSADQLREEMRRYVQRIQEMAEGAIEKSAPGEQAYCVAASLLADLALNHLYDFDMHRKNATLYLEQCPGVEEDRPSYLLSMGQSYVFGGQYNNAVAFMRQAIEKYPDDPERVLYNIPLFEALTGVGDLESMEELLVTIQAEYPGRLEKLTKPSLRTQCEQWFDTSSFWLGWVRFARGDIAGATAALEESMAHLDRRRAELAKEGKQLPNVQDVFQRFRAAPLLAHLGNFHGRVPETDLKGIDWVTSAQLTLDETRGRVVVILCRNPGDPRRRAESILVEVDRLARAHEDVVAVTLGFQSPKSSDERREEMRTRMKENLDELGLSLPAGFDSTDGYEHFTKLNGILGTASLVVLDRQGRSAWYLVDPKDTEKQVLVRVVQRLLEQ